MATATRQVQQEIIGDRDVLIRIQEPSSYEHHYPDLPAQYISARICGNRVYDASGRLWADIGEQGMNALLALVPTYGSAPQDALWKAFADNYDLDPTHYNTCPLVLCLPPQPRVGGLSVDALVAQFIA